MPIHLAAFLIGAVAGLRSMTAPAAVSLAARLGWISLDNTVVSFLSSPLASWLLAALAIGEIVNDKLPKTPSRKAPVPFIGRILLGGASGYALGATAGSGAAGLVLGGLGAVAGTLGGYEFRARLVRATGGNDLPIALLEDAIAVGGALLIVSHLR